MKKRIRCLIVDDEPLAIGLLEKHVQQFSQLELVASCWNAMQAFEILKEQAIDLIFLDIQMPGLNGIEFVKSLQNPPCFIFTTAYRDYAVESYELNAIDYLLKPITFNRFFKSINTYFDKIHNISAPIANPPLAESDQFIYVNTNRKFVKVNFADVLFIESMKDYVQIHLAEQKIITKDKISKFNTKLPGHFIRVHRCFIVNVRKITAYTHQDIEINNREIPIGISYKNNVMQFLKQKA